MTTLDSTQGIAATKALIIGYGSIGKLHAEILSGLIGNQNVCLVSRQQGIEDFKVYPELTDIDLTVLSSFDYFVIASETSQHHPQLTYLNDKLRNKRILVEKPLFDLPKSLNAQNDIFVAYNLRFHKYIQRLVSDYDEQKIFYMNVHVGQYLPSWRPERDYRESYSADPKKGGGVLNDLSHELDYISYIAGRISDVTGISEKISDLDIQSEDFVALVGKTDKSVRFSVVMDYIAFKPRRFIVVQGENTCSHCDLVSGTYRLFNTNGELIFSMDDTFQRQDTYTEMHHQLLKKRFDELCSFNSGHDIVELIEKVKK